MSQDQAEPFFPDLQTPRLALRALTLADTAFVYQHFSDPQVTQYLMDEPPVASEEEAQAIIRFFLEPEGKTHNRWGIVRRADGRLIGTCGFHHWEKAYFRAEIGYDLAPDCWGQGYMGEALRAAIDHGFTRLGLHRMDAYIYTGNPRSFRLVEKLGFQREGLLRDYFSLDGKFYDHYLYGLLHSDWRG